MTTPVQYDSRFDSAGTNRQTGGAGGTVASNSNRYLAAWLMATDSGGVPSSFTSVHWNVGTPELFTFIAGITSLDGFARIELWGLKNPTPAASTEVFGDVGATVETFGVLGLSYYDVDQTTSIGTAVSARGAINTVTTGGVTISGTVTDGMCIGALLNMLTVPDPSTLSDSGGQTFRNDINNVGPNIFTAACAEEASTPSSNAMAWTASDAGLYVSVGVELKPVSAVVPIILNNLAHAAHHQAQMAS